MACADCVGEKSVTGGSAGSALQDHLPVFDIDLAFTMLHMSAIIYERCLPVSRYLTSRDTDLLGFATDLYDSVIVRMMRMGQPIPSTPFLQADKSLAPLRYTIEKCLFGANRNVIAQAKKWGMNFMAVSDLNGRTVNPSEKSLML